MRTICAARASALFWRFDYLSPLRGAVASNGIPIRDNNSKFQRQACAWISTSKPLQDQHQLRRRHRAAPVLLSMDVIRNIKRDLVQADANHDQRIDFEDLRQLLGKYRTFSDDQIEQIGDLFYIGTSGKSVRHATFLRALQHIASASDGNGSCTSNGSSNNHPLPLESLEDKRCFISPDDSPYYEVQKRFDQMMLDYVRQVNLLEEIGGQKVLDQANALFYTKVIQDDQLQPFFREETKAKASLEKCMGLAFSRNIPAGKTHAAYQTVAKRIRPLVKEKGLNEDHFDLMLGYFIETLEELNIANDIIDMATEMMMSFRYIFASRLLDQLGGRPVLHRAQDIFFDKTLQDERLAPFFANTDIKAVKRKNLNFISIAFGSKSSNNRSIMLDEKTRNYIYSIHATMIEEEGLGVEHFDITMGHFFDTLTELNIDPLVIDTAMNVVSSYRVCFEKEFQQSFVHRD